MKEEREIVDVIVDKLKNMPDRPYKDRSWEAFRAAQLATKKRRLSTLWYAAASLLLCMGVGAAGWLLTQNSAPVQSLSVRNGVETVGHAEADSTPIDNSVPTTTDGDMEKTHFADEQLAATVNPPPARVVVAPFGALTQGMELNRKEEVSIPQLTVVSEQRITGKHSVHLKPPRTMQHIENHYFASTATKQPGVLALKSPEQVLPRKRVPLNNRFELGLFVSSYATSNQMKVGGGLTLSYKLGKNLSLRTGASYNSYEIQTIKDPVATSSTEVVPATEVEMALSSDLSSNATYQRQMIIPHINAITGFVKSVDIPLELKVNDNNNRYYATAGMAYSAIFDQERQAHYVENLNKETFISGYPENQQQAKEAVRPVTRTVISAEENVNSKGFNGFVNLSIGRNIRVNPKVGISVEPYLKVPLGQYRRADMDYTNGGIRVITSF